MPINRCPVDNSIFPNFYQSGNALESSYEAFRFTESYGVIFQCNVKYCIGKCEPVICGVGRDNIESWGRRRRSIDPAEDEMTLSKEILVLDAAAANNNDDDNSNNDNNSLDSQNSKYAPPEDNFEQTLTFVAWPSPNTTADSYLLSDPRVQPGDCISKTYAMTFACLCAFLLVMYVFTILYFTRRRLPATPAHFKYMH